MMKVKSLQKKLLFNYVLSIFLGFILFSFALFWLLTFGLYKKIDGILISESEWIENVIKAEIQYGEDEVIGEISEHIETTGADEYTIVFSKDLKIIYSSPNLNKSNFPLSLLQQIETINTSSRIQSIKINKNDMNYRVLAKRIVLPENKEFILEISASLREVEALQRQLIYWLLVIAPLVGIPFILWARSFASKISRPLEEMSAGAKKITVNKLSKNIEIRSSYKEANDLADSFNDMIQRLDQSILEIKRFTSDASHELRTPLSVLKSQIQIALRNKETPHQFGEIFKNELVEVNYMEKIVDNLLTLSRYDSGKITLKKSIVDLSDLCIEQYEKIKILAKSKNVRIVLGSIHPAKIMGDKIFLTQVIFNLLDNAVKYNKEGGKVYIDLRVLQEEESCLVTIRNTGTGIPKADIHRVFDRFYRVDKSRSREIMGSGLGLSIVKLIVELHGGKVTIGSEENKTIVIVALPLSS